MWLGYILAGAVAALGLWAAWLSGRDVGMRNARRAEEEEEPTVMLTIQTREKGKYGVCTDEHSRKVRGADPVRAENAGDQKDGTGGETGRL